MNFEPEHLLNLWSGGQLLAFSGIDGSTDYNNCLVARIAFAGSGLDVVHPAAGAIRFHDAPPERAFVCGDAFRISAAGSEISGAFLDTYHLLLEGKCEVTGEGLESIREGKRTLIAPRGRLDRTRLSTALSGAFAERTAWLRQLELPAGVSSVTQRALAKAASQMKTQIYALEGGIRRRWSTPDRWPHRAMWLWDSVFHAVGWRHFDLPLARDLISAVLDRQRGDGMVPHALRPDGASAITQPPVLAFGAALLEEQAPDLDWVRDLYPKLEAYLEWDFANRDSDGYGLVEWAIETNVNCRSGESGMDNSPRFDRCDRLDAVDFNSFLACECEAMAGFSRRLGKAAAAARWEARRERLCGLINARLWDEEAGFYLDFDLDGGARQPLYTCVGFLPLLCGAASPKQARRLAEKLRDPRYFATPLPVPSVAAVHAADYAKDMWRGPVWINMNWLIARGLTRYGLHDEARTLLSRTMAELESQYEKYGSFFEFYDCEKMLDPPRLLRKGKCAPEVSPYHQVFFDYGWTATLYVDMVFAASQGERR